MRYAIVSDLHANFEAWKAVRVDLHSLDVDEIICLGDIVGYGPSPAEVLKNVYGHVHHFVLGNHDAAVCGMLDPTLFNEDARIIIDWTQRELDAKASAFFKTLPYVLRGPRFRCTHGDPVAPANFGYVLEPEHAANAWRQCDEQLIFIGHSHVPGIFVVGDSGTPHWVGPRDFAIESGKRYIVNAGSVGQPRDGDVRASYCIYDTDCQSVNFRRVPFDIDAYRDQLQRTELSARASYFLGVPAAREPTPLRELLDFHPLDKAPTPTEDVGVKQLEGVQRAARRWRAGAAVMLGLLLVLAVAVCLLWTFGRPNAVTYRALRTLPPSDVVADLGVNCLREPEAVGLVSANNRLADWTVTLTDPRRQELTAEAPPDDAAGKERRTALRIRSERPRDVVLASSPMPARARMRFSIAASFLRQGHLSGSVILSLVQQAADGTETVIMTRPVDDLQDGEWVRRSMTMERRRGGLRADGAVRVVLHGQFAGDLSLRSCALVFKEDHADAK